MLRAWHDLSLPDQISHTELTAEQNVCALCSGPYDEGPEGHLVGPFKMGGKGNSAVWTV
jgi:hypothetical protein